MHSAPTINRFEWMKAVMQAEGLTATAKNVAAVLAIQFANDQTGQANPSQTTLADYLKVHKDTIKRVMRELRNAGWLVTIGTGGRSKAPMIRFISPSKIIPFHDEKRGGKSPPDAEKRGGNMCEKGGQITPSHYKDKQSLEQKGAHLLSDATDALNRFKDHRFIGSPHTGPSIIAKTDHALLNRWAEWLSDQGFPKLCELNLQRSPEGTRKVFFQLPGRNLPTSPDAIAEARWFFETLVDAEGGRHAAQ